MFSHALVSYQSVIQTFSTKASDTLSVAASKLNNVQPYDFCVVSELATNPESEDKDQKTFFNADYSDNDSGKKVKKESKSKDGIKERSDPEEDVSNLLGEEFYTPPKQESPIEEPKSASSELLGLQWPSNSDLLGGGFMPSRFIQEGKLNFSADLTPTPAKVNSKTVEQKDTKEAPIKKKAETTNSQMSWLSLFAELDPLANQDDNALNAGGDRA